MSDAGSGSRILRLRRKIPPLFGERIFDLVCFWGLDGFAGNFQKVLTVDAFLELLSERNKLVVRDESLVKSDFLRTRYAQPLTFYERLHKSRCLEQAVWRAHVEPGESATQSPHVELAPLEICAVNIGDLQFATSGRIKMSDDLDYLLIIKIETCDRPT